MKTQLYCGASKVRINPPEELFPFGAAKGREYYGNLDDVCVRAIALKAGDTTVLLVAFDSSAGPDPDTFVGLITEATGVPEQNVIYFSTHNHSNVNPKLKGDAAATLLESPQLAAFVTMLKEAAVQVTVDAINCMRPARFGYGEGKSYINVNRNQVYYVRNEKNEIIDRYCLLGQNWEGPSDKTLAVMRFEDMDGKVIAFFVNYAVHCNALYGNMLLDGKPGISGGIAGLTSGHLEKRFHGCVAMWSSGAAGDQCAINMNHVYYPSPEDGHYYETVVKHGDYENIQALSARHFDDILLTNDKIVCNTAFCCIKTAMGVSRTPGRDVAPCAPEDPSGVRMRDVRILWSEYEKGNLMPPMVYSDSDNPYMVCLQLIRLGDIALVGISGELYSSLGTYLKEHSPLKNTVLITHASSLKYGSGYIFDDEGCNMGGNGALTYYRSRMKPGYIKESLKKTLDTLFNETRE